MHILYECFPPSVGGKPLVSYYGFPCFSMMCWPLVSCTLQVRDSTIIITLSPTTMLPASLAARWTLPLASSTWCATWAWPRTARECPTRWSWPEYSAPETEATGVAKLVGVVVSFEAKQPKRRSFTVLWQLYIFSSSEDKSQLHEGLNHILLVFVVFVAVT